MKKITACVLALMLLASLLLPVAATDVQVENASKPAVNLSVTDAQKDCVRVTVSLSGCMGLESADLRFNYNNKNLTFLGATLLGAVAEDADVYAVFSDMDSAEEMSRVSVSLFHMESFSAAEGNGDFCELAFRIENGSSKIGAEAESFVINGESVSPSLGSCRCSGGFGSFLQDNGSVVFVIVVIAVILIVLLVLLVVVRKLKKAAVQTAPTAELFGDEPTTTAEKPKSEDSVDEPEQNPAEGENKE